MNGEGPWGGGEGDLGFLWGERSRERSQTWFRRVACLTLPGSYFPPGGTEIWQADRELPRLAEHAGMSKAAQDGAEPQEILSLDWPSTFQHGAEEL